MTDHERRLLVSHHIQEIAKLLLQRCVNKPMSDQTPRKGTKPGTVPTRYDGWDTVLDDVADELRDQLRLIGADGSIIDPVNADPEYGVYATLADWKKRS